MEKQNAQQDNRFLKGRQIAYLIFGYFKIRGTGQPLLDFNDLLRIQLKNDIEQGFDTKRDEVLLSLTNALEKDLFEVLDNKQLHYSEEFKHLMASYLQDTVQKGEPATGARLKQMVPLCAEQEKQRHTFQFTQRRQVS